MAIHLGLKCGIVACQAFLNDVTILQAIIVMLLIFTYLGFLIHAKPYKKNEHTIIDIFCQMCSIITLSCGILFYVLQFDNTSNNGQIYADPLTFIVVASTIVLSLVVLVQMRKDYKNGKNEKESLEEMKLQKPIGETVVKSSTDDIIREETSISRKPTTGRSRGAASVMERQRRTSSMVTNGTEVPPIFQDDLVQRSSSLAVKATKGNEKDTIIVKSSAQLNDRK